ncbi:hypothetical protein IAR55_005477 [Kwoniella newhampshirensis]|uniref:WSC domain-containing protein n=1 Tax=Kwoniella newhampshirensis TaxID=1651941 RepID=A0AAW0YTU9_9TREE
MRVDALLPVIGLMALSGVSAAPASQDHIDHLDKRWCLLGFIGTSCYSAPVAVTTTSAAKTSSSAVKASTSSVAASSIKVTSSSAIAKASTSAAATSATAASWSQCKYGLQPPPGMSWHQVSSLVSKFGAKTQVAGPKASSSYKHGCSNPWTATAPAATSTAKVTTTAAAAASTSKAVSASASASKVSAIVSASASKSVVASSASASASKSAVASSAAASISAAPVVSSAPVQASSAPAQTAAASVSAAPVSVSSASSALAQVSAAQVSSAAPAPSVAVTSSAAPAADVPAAQSSAAPSASVTPTDGSVSGTPGTGAGTPGSGSGSASGTSTTDAAPAATSAVAEINGYVDGGCVQEVAGRLLSKVQTSGSSMTVESCTSICLSYGYGVAGVEYGNECYCGVVGDLANIAVSGQCYMPCAGDSTETCGGPNALNIYVNDDIVPATAVLPTGWTTYGVVSEGPDGRALTYTLWSKSDNTVETCASGCAAAGYTVSGTEYSSECYCGNGFSNGGGALVDPSAAFMACSGNLAESCGGPSILSVTTSIVGTIPSI